MKVEVSPARRELVKALGATRLSEGRLAGGFAYAPLSPEGTQVRSSRALREARATIERAFKREGSVESLADIGVLSLMGGRLDKAIAFLRQATQQDPGNPSNWSDLAAAHLEKYDKASSFTDLLDALQAAKQAVEIDSSHLEARFNYALALDHLSLRWRARAAWSQYRDLDGDSEWSQEAASRFAGLLQPSYEKLWIDQRTALEHADPAEIEVLARKLVRLFPQQAREMVEEDLLGRWAMQLTQRRLTEAERTLALAKAVGKELANSRGEYMIADSVIAIEVAVSQRRKSIDWLVVGHMQHRKGLEEERSEAFQAASRHFEAASEALTIAGSPFVLWTRFRLAVCAGQLFQYGAALKRLEGLGGARNWSRYPAIQARAAWVSGLYHMIRGNPAEALAAYRHAWEVFGKLGEQENRAAVSNLLAEAHRKLGDRPGVWKYHGLAVGGLRYVVNSRRRRPILAELGASLAEYRPRLSVYVQEELLRGYTDSVPPGIRVGGIRRMAEARNRENARESALSLVRMAEMYVGSVSEPQVQQALLADLVALEGEIESEVDAHRAVRLLTTAIGSFEKTEYLWQLVRLLLQRARALRQIGRLDAAESSLVRAIELLGSYSSSESLMAPSFHEVREVFQEMVRVQLLQGHSAAAFEFTEKGRSLILSLMSPIGIPPSPVFAIEQIQRELPERVALVNWWISGNEIFSWTLRRDRFDVVIVPVDPSRLSSAVLKFRKAVSADNPTEAGLVAPWLYATLIAAIRSNLDGTDRLVLVPDGILTTLPFTALQDSANAPYMIEQYTISVAPTASLYLHCLRRAREMAGAKLEVMAVANPSFDRKVFGDLPLLPYTEAEASQIVNTYPDGRLITGRAATRRTLESEMANWSVLHIGGHTVANATNPFTSALVLAPLPGDSGAFYFRDLVKVRLERLRLAVFSACSTLRGEAGIGVELAEPLLAQGVPAVIGTLWSMRDRHAVGLTFGFHQRFHESRDAAMALRETQVELLSDPTTRERMSVWAAFQLTGAR